MTEKVLVITCQEFAWHIRARAIAHHYATYYARKEDELYQGKYAQMHAQMLAYDEALWPWYKGEMDWDEIPETEKVIATVHQLRTPNNVRNFLDEAKKNTNVWTHTIIEREW